MGLERLHDAGHRALPDHGAGRDAGLQLVELVLPGSASRRAAGCGDQPALAAGGGGQGRQSRRADPAVPHTTARQAADHQGAYRQRPHGHAAGEGDYGAVATHRSLERATAQDLPAHRSLYRPSATTQPLARYRVTAGIGVN